MEYAELFCSDVLRAGKKIVLTATGTSMWPLITEGMKAEIVPLRSKIPQKGQLLLIKRENGLMVHRCWGVSTEWGRVKVFTKGDANLGFDSPVDVEQILGEVKLLKHDAKRGSNPNKGILKLYGSIICSSRSLARVWAGLCRLALKILVKIRKGG